MHNNRRATDQQRKPARSISQYAAKAHDTNRFADDPDGLLKLRYGFFGEVGSLLSSIKRASRDSLPQAPRLFAREELGDALWYLTAYAMQRGIKPDLVAAECWNELRELIEEKPKQPKSSITFRQIDGLLALQRNLPQSNDEMLGALAFIAGDLAKAEIVVGKMSSKLPNKLGKVLSKLALVGAAHDWSLEDIAEYNLAKIDDRWPLKREWIPLFDESKSIPKHERFPRKFKVRFEERDGDSKRPHVVQSIRGVFVGDRLTDNHETEDGYRFHDVFHLAYVAYLGWSPVIRALLKLKRKSNPAIDENQDGARAIIIEEGIATWIFNHAANQKMFADVRPLSLDYSVLKQIRSMVQGYEVEAAPMWQWEEAILNGFAVFRQLYKERRGTVLVDMTEHSLTFKSDNEK